MNEDDVQRKQMSSTVYRNGENTKNRENVEMRENASIIIKKQKTRSHKYRMIARQ
jgi:hypothetical protein